MKEHTKISFKTKDNLHTLRKWLDSPIKKIGNEEIIMKPADKGSVIVIISPDYYWNICQSHILDTSYYRMLNDTDPSNIVQQRVTQFSDKYKSMLTLKEYNYLTKRKHKIPNLYMFLKLHKTKQINEIIQKQQCEYMNCEENIIQAGPIVAGPNCHSSISEIDHIIMEPSIAMILHIAKDSFDFKNRLDKHCSAGTTLSTCEIKSLYTKIPHDLFYTVVECWIENLQYDLPLLRRFNKQFILEALSIILEFIYFYINAIYIHQIKGTAMGTKFAIVGSNLLVAYEEVKLHYYHDYIHKILSTFYT